MKFFFIIALLPLFSVAQSVEVIDEEVRQTAYQNKSYLVIKGLTIRPPAGGSFTVSAATHGNFYIKIATAAKITSNVPPNTDQNFVREEIILKPGVTSETQIADVEADKKSVSFKYVDGLSRPLLDVQVKGSPKQFDIIQPYSYDDKGRSVNEYLPYAGGTQNGSFHTSSLTEQSSFYAGTSGVATDGKPYTLKVFDDSPLNQVRKAYGTGAAWQPGPGSNDKSVQAITKVNIAGEVVLWKFDGLSAPSSNGSWLANTLSVAETIDEQGQISRSYQNFKGQVIYTRKGNNSEWFDTYFIYDVQGNLSYVFPPEASNRLTAYANASAIDKQLFLDRWCFQYRYDDYQRQTEKRVPGADWVYMIYDKWDRLVFTQDGNLRLNNQWVFTKYDVFNRPVITGITTGTRSSLISAAENPATRFESRANNSIGYTNSAIPSSTLNDMLVIKYYDDYYFKAYTGWEDGTAKDYSFVNEVGGFPQSTDIFTTVKGHTTGSKVRILGTSTWLNSVIYYDNRYRNIQTIAENYMGGQGRVTSAIDFSGRIVQMKQVHTGTNSVTLLNEFNYDHASRLKQTYQTIDNGQRVLLADNQYNELGQLIEKNIHSSDNGANYLQSVDYRYTIRGWLSSINNSSLSNDGILNNDSNDLFGMQLNYNQQTTIAGAAIDALHNGNISSIQWNANNLKDLPKQKIYGYQYDVLNRLKNSSFDSNSGSGWGINANAFNESMTYDKNGNIKTLNRSAMMGGQLKTIDQLDYKYGTNTPDFDNNGNRLTYLDDASAYSDATQNNPDFGFAENTKRGNMGSITEYGYDNNGNLKIDYNKGITGSSGITYNYLNLPVMIPLQGGTITYTYDATGNKLRKVLQSGSNSQQTDYAGSIHYVDNQIAFILTSEGRAVKKGSEYVYEYFHKDHLGNTRVVYGYEKETRDYKATLEPERAPKESEDFKNIAGTSGPNKTLKNFETPTPLYSAALNGSVGPAIMLTVGNGDNVNIEAHAFYNQPVSSNAIGNVALASAVAGAFVLSPGEGTTAFTNSTQGAFGTFSANAGAPKAFVFYYLFSPDFTTWSQFGFARVTTDATAGFEKLSLSVPISLPAGISEAKMYIYVANQTIGTTVWFDDLGIIHEKNNNKLQVVQTNDYYPFGLAISQFAYQKQSTDLSRIKNKYKFQGQERQEEFNFGWDDFKNRMYDPAIGRFGGVDKLSEKLVSQSNYNFTLNNPVTHVDPDGNYPGYYMDPGIAKYNEQRQASMYQNMNIAVQVANANNGYPTSWMAYQAVSQGGEWKGPDYKNYSSVEADDIRYLRNKGSYDKSNEGNVQGVIAAAATVAYMTPVVGNVAKTMWDVSKGDAKSAAIHGSLAMLDMALGEGGELLAGIKVGSRAFWSGAGTEAQALEYGFSTLGQTRAGKNLIKLTEGMDYYPAMNGQPASQAYQWWARLSTKYAEGASGTVHIFQNAQLGVDMNSIWRLYEYPALLKNPNVTNIIYHY